MALDIARILIYGGGDGSMKSSPQRRHLLLVDGIVGGEGWGPLAPHATPAGVLLFSNDIALGDWACAWLMGFDPQKIRLIADAFQPHRYPVSSADPAGQSAILNGAPVRLDDPSWIRNPFRPPPGWVGHIELSRVSHG
jgi:uncharacterized protein (DUF362 family)